ncbi:MAG: sulfite exporter TauE/SafE family protein, partial [Candidatus Aminicenantes bacterium]|nr:sulfite exporter TauE/SafE family protein [Candidatus Aminicenantes bacterium]
MDALHILIASFVSFLVSIFSVSVGGTALITVPMLISLGMVSNNAVATNMFALIFLSVSGAFGFREAWKVKHGGLFIFLSLLTVCGSFIGANLIVSIDRDILETVIGVMIFIMAAFFIIKKDLGVLTEEKSLSRGRLIAGTLLVFILGVYGGFFSGGYVTVLSYVLVLVFSMNFLEAALMTKLLNIFSSLVACVFFFVHDLIDFHVGIPLAI